MHILLQFAFFKTNILCDRNLLDTSEERRHKAGIGGGGTEREDTRMQTEVVWTREENGRERVC